jgi:hypothetical protein
MKGYGVAVRVRKVRRGLLIVDEQRRVEVEWLKRRGVRAKGVTGNQVGANAV